MSEGSLSFPHAHPPAGLSEAAATSPGRAIAAGVSSRASSRTLVYALLGVILLLGGVFRLTGVDWDQGQHLHPDERFLTMVTAALKLPAGDPVAAYFDEAQSTLNPRNVGFTFYVYGNFPILIVKAVSVLVDRSGYDEVHLVGRAVDAVVDLGTVVMLFLLARTLYRDDRVALLAGLLYSLTALAIQHAHFFVVESFTVFFVTTALYYMARVFRDGQTRDYLLAGIFVGLALASKISIYSIVLVMATVGTYRVYRAWRDPTRDTQVAFEQVAARLVLSGLAAFVAFRICEPYAFHGPGIFGILPSERWIANALEAREWVSGDRDAPFAHQWANRTPILFPLQNMVLWGMGVPLGLTVWAGFAVASWQLLRQQRWAHLIPVFWSGMLFLLLGTQWVKSTRYMLPIYPTLILLGAWLLIWAWDRRRILAGLTLAGVVLGTALYAAAFTSIYTRTHTRVEASRWIFANVPAGTVVANETSWDDGLPLRVDGKDGFAPGMYTGLNLELTAEDSPDKLRKLLASLDRAEYLFISSNRQYDGMTRLPMRFPMVVNYYEALFSGQLGFERVAEFTSYPGLFGLELPDQGAEEAWSVYDHPRVQIFRKTAAYSHDRAEALIGDVNWDGILQLLPKQASRTRNALLLSPREQELYQAAGTWTEIYDLDGLASRSPVLVWALVVAVFGLLAVPYLWLLSGPLPDRGYALAKSVGLLAVAWLAWWLASLELVAFSASSVLLVLWTLAVGALALAVARDRELAGWVRTHWRVLLASEAVFWSLFGIGLLVRWANPDLWHPSLGGEKPMDLAYLNAVVKSPYFPPYDPWFAGGYINYYYFGFVLVAALVKLSGIETFVAYNLIVPTLLALLGQAAFGATLALVSARPSLPALSRRPLLFGLFGSLFVAVIGNLRELTLILEGFAMLSSVKLQSSIPGLEALVKGVHGFLTGFLAGKPLPFRQEWWYWNATRVIQHPPTEAGPINEFPWFTYLFADLHAHAMALPYTVVALALALIFVREQGAGSGLWISLGRLALLALVLGALYPMNTWDFPTYALVALSALGLRAWQQQRRLTPNLVMVVAGRWLLLLGLSYLLFLPFHQHFGTAESGLDVWRGSQTSIGDYLTMHGFFLFAIVAGLLTDFWFSRDLNGSARLLRLGLRRWYRLDRLLPLRRRLVRPSTPVGLGLRSLEIVMLVAVGMLLLGKVAPALIIVLLALTALLFFRDSGRATGSARGEAPVLWQMALIMIFAGLGLTLAVEFVVLKNIDISRMNTVFKFYLQVWVLWAVAAAAAAGFVFQRLPALQLRWQSIWRRGFAFLLAATLLYPLFATRAKIEDRFEGSASRGLNGMAFMEQAVLRDKDQQIALQHDLDAIRWMQQHLEGSPVIAEVNTAPTLYGWGNRFAVFTGNPAVVGWDWHQRQQRAAVPGTMINRRIEDLQRAYSTTDPEQAYRLLSKYGVQYLVVGGLERAYYPAGQQKWQAAEGRRWNLVYENPGVKIYRLIEPSLAGTGNGPG